MNLDGGRAMLYSALQTLQGHWQQVDPHWQDAMRVQFVEQVWEPLHTDVTAALEAVDQMQALLHQMRRDCEGDEYDIYR